MLSIERISEMNPWWKAGKVKEEFAFLYKRELFQEILKYLELRQIIGIVGLRRVGKTTLLYQLIDYLIKRNINPKDILYFSFDEIKEDVREILRVYEENVIKEKIGERKVFIFLDEIQKLGDWQDKIKVFYDLHPNIKFFVSGSASLDILLKGKESLAGRIFYFYLSLLSFEEFLELRKKDVKRIKENLDLWKTELRIELNNYSLKPLPEIVDFPDDIAKKYIKEAVIEKIILSDMRSLFEVREIEIVGKIIDIIASNPGLIINLDDIAKDFGASRQVLSNYLFYLCSSFLIVDLKNFRGSVRAASRKLKKYYPLHPCFSTSADTGKIAENLVAFKTRANRYWREGEKEVDFILKNKEILPIEVKYKRQVKKNELKGLLKFMEKFNLKEALVITEDYESEEWMEGKEIRFLPLWKWLLN